MSNVTTTGRRRSSSSFLSWLASIPLTQYPSYHHHTETNKDTHNNDHTTVPQKSKLTFSCQRADELFPSLPDPSTDLWKHSSPLDHLANGEWCQMCQHRSLQLHTNDHRSFFHFGIFLLCQHLILLAKRLLENLHVLHRKHLFFLPTGTSCCPENSSSQ